MNYIHYTRYLPLFFLLMLSCNEDPIEEPTSFQWTVSEFSQISSSFNSFQIGDDGELYSTGWVYTESGQSQFGIHRALANYKWELVREIDPSQLIIQDFAIFNQDIYVVNNKDWSLWKSNGTTWEKFDLNNFVTGVAAFKGKLILTGDFNDSFVVSYDGTSFTPIVGNDEAFEGKSSFILKEEDKLLIGNNATYQYDGISLTKIEYYDYATGIHAIDNEGNFYTIGYSNGVSQVYKNGFTDKVGPLFDERVTINSIFFQDKKLIAIGTLIESGFSVTYYLGNNEWKEVPTTNYFLGAFTYDGRLFAYTGTGIITELVGFTI